MLCLSATDLAIRLAKESGTLTVIERVNRFGDAFWAIEDDHGTITVALSEDESRQIVAGNWNSKPQERLAL